MRSTGTKLNSQIERTINRKIQTSLEMFKNVLFHLRLTEWSVFTLILVVLNSKYFSSDEKTTTNKNALQENVRTSWISFSLSQNSHRTRQTNADDKGCAEACAERFSALKDQHWRHVVSSLSRGHFRNVFVKSSEMLGFWSFIFL